MATTNVKLNLISGSDPDSFRYEINPNGRFHGVKEDLGDGDFRLYVQTGIITKNEFQVYTSIVRVYEYSAKFDSFRRAQEVPLIVNDTTYVNSQGQIVEDSEALNLDGSLKSGYLTEAMFFELALGNTIAQFESAAIARRFNLTIV